MRTHIAMQLHRPKAVELQQHKSPHVSGFLQHRPFQKEQSSRSPVQGAQNTALFCWCLTSKKEPTPNKSLLQFQANNTDTHTQKQKSTQNEQREGTNTSPELRALPKAVSEELIFFASSKVSPVEWLRPQRRGWSRKRRNWEAPPLFGAHSSAGL